MKRIALAAGPRTSCPDDIFTSGLLCDFSDGLVVAQRIKIVFVPTSLSRCVLTGKGGAFTKVHFDRADTHLQQVHQLLLIPLHSLRISDIKCCIFKRQLAALVFYRVAFINHLFPEMVLASEIGVLPQTHMEALRL